MTSGESLRRLGGVGAAVEATVLSVNIVGLIVSSPVLQPWLAVLFGINAGLAFAGFWPGPGKPHGFWMGLAILLPLAGIAVFSQRASRAAPV